MTMEKFHFKGADGKDYTIPYLQKMRNGVVRPFMTKFRAIGVEASETQDKNKRGLLSGELSDSVWEVLEAGLGSKSKEWKALDDLNFDEANEIVERWFTSSGGEGAPLETS